MEILNVNVSGEGIVAELCQDLVGVLRPLVKIVNVDFEICLPHPKTPDFQKYKIIAALLIISWIILFLEPYSLRFRNIIMDHYYPERAKDRAVWLYQKVMTKRTSFFKYAKRKVFKKLTNGENEEKSRSCMEIFRAKFEDIWICRKIFGYNKDLCCILCGDQHEDE